MILKRLVLTDFLSHKQTEINFDPMDRVLIDGPSGVGKSSIVDGIIFGLFGVGRVDPKNLIRKGSNGLKVIVELQDGTTLWRVVRGISKKGSQTLEVGCEEAGVNVPVPATSVKEKQTFIEKSVLRSSYELFANSVLFPQDGTTFVKATAAERKDLLMEIVGAAELDEFGDRVKETFSVVDKDLSAASSKVTTLQGIIASSEQSVRALSEKTSDPELALKRAQDALEAVTAQEKAVSALEAQIEPIRARFMQSTALERDIARLKPLAEAVIDVSTDWGARAVAMENAMAELAGQRKRLTMLEEIKTATLTTKAKLRPQDPTYATRKADLEKRLMLAMTADISGKKCAKCGEPYADAVAEKQKRVNELTEDLLVIETAEAARVRANAEVEAEIRFMAKVDESEIANLKTMLADEPKVAAEIQRCRGNAENLKNALAARESAKIDLAKAETDYALVKDASAEMNRQQGLVHAAHAMLVMHRTAYTEAVAIAERAKSEAETIVRAKETLEKIKGDLESALKDQGSLTVLAENLKLLKDAFGANGIKVTVIESLVPQIELKINEILSELSDFSVRLETQRDGAKEGTKVDGLFIDVINAEGEAMDFDSFSGGERVKISIAVSEALATLQKSEFRILDEAFQGLDVESTERFAETLSRLQTRYPQVLCISHLPEIKNLFDKKIELSKKDGISSVK